LSAHQGSIPDAMTIQKLRNWAGNYTYAARGLHYPETVEQVQELVYSSSRLKVLGSRHSFNDIADTQGDLISLDHFDRLLATDRQRNTVTVDAGVRYGQICSELHREGYALYNLASLPHISVAGACATATHGSGEGNGNLATAVSAMELVTAGGEVVVLSRDPDGGDGEPFRGAVVGLGALGVVTKLTLDTVPTFTMRQDVYENLPLAQLEEHFDEIESSAYSVSLFTDCRSDRVNQVWLKRRIRGAGANAGGAELELEREWFGATLAQTHLHPIGSLSAESCTEQMGIPGPWHERLPHFRMDFTPSSGEELQSEYLVPRRHAVTALLAINRMRDRVAPLLQISEVRTIAADDLWMSTCYEQASVAIHFTWKKNWPEVRKLLPLIEAELSPLNARPHWGKLFTMPPEQVQSLYPKLQDFERLVTSYDPEGKFRNAFLDRYIFGAH
jgi:xylitol oxidase